MAPQAYKVVRTQDNEISGWTIPSRLIHSRDPHLGGMNGDVQSDLSTLAFKNGEKFEYFNSTIIRFKQDIMLYGETVSPTRILFQYMKELSKNDRIKAFIPTNMTDLITLLDNNRKSALYTGG